MMLFLRNDCHRPQYLLEPAEAWIPYRSENGKFGFVNQDGELKIEPQYEDASPFENGVAIVRKDKQYGVINAENEIILPLKYAAIERVRLGQTIFVSTKSEYNAWWQFWNWRILPGLNFLGGNSGPFLLTKVPRALYKVQMLKEGQQLFFKRETDHDLGVSYWSENWEPQHFVPYAYQPRMLFGCVIEIEGHFYKRGKKKWKPLSKAVTEISNDHIWLYQKGDAFYLGDPKGNPIGKGQLKKVDSLVVREADGRPIVVSNPIPGMPPYTVFQNPIYLDQSGQYFISPQLETGFPRAIAPYQKDSVHLSAHSILASAVQIIPWNARSFLIVSMAGGGKGYKAYFLQSDGQWKVDVPTQGAIVPNHAGAGLTLAASGKYWMIHRNFSITAFPGDFIPIWGHPDWYFVLDKGSQNYGIYKPEKQRWLVPAKYHTLETTADPDVAIYSLVEENGDHRTPKYGLLNMASKKRITPPCYTWIEQDGRVRALKDGKMQAFYVGLQTGREYREEDEQGKRPSYKKRSCLKQDERKSNG